MMLLNMLIKIRIVCLTSSHGRFTHDKIKKSTFSGTAFSNQSPVLTFFKTEIQTLKNKCIEMSDTYIFEGNERIIQIGFFMSTRVPRVR